MSSSPTLALVGCGAIADAFHLPALRNRPDLVTKLILVDKDLSRAEAVRQRIGAASAVADYKDVIGKVQGAIVATPHHLHAPLTRELVENGVHVLCEKPLAQTAAEVDDIVEAAKRNRVSVAVNHTRRLFSSFQRIQKAISSGELGQLQNIDYVLGEPFAWPAATDTYFGVRAGGRGVLFDTGAHIIDLVCWWMGGQPELLSYADDSRDGTEAVAKVRLGRGQATAEVHLSWLSKLRNRYRVVGSKGTIEGGVYEWSSYTFREPGGRARTVQTDKARTFTDFADKLLTNFTEVIAGRASPIVSAEDARASVAVIDNCYAHRTRMEEPWHDAFGRLTHV